MNGFGLSEFKSILLDDQSNDTLPLYPVIYIPFFCKVLLLHGGVDIVEIGGVAVDGGVLVPLVAPGGDLLHDGVYRGVKVDDKVGTHQVVQAVVVLAVVEITGCKMIHPTMLS